MSYFFDDILNAILIHNPFREKVPFVDPLEMLGTRDFLMFSVGIEREFGLEMG